MQDITILDKKGCGILLAVLTVNNVTKNYRNEDALKNVSFNIEPGRIVGLLGPNGSGKTTLIKIITGLIHDYTGEVLVKGMPVGKDSKAIVSYLPDREFLPDWIRVDKAITLFEDVYPDFDRLKAEEIVQRMGLDRTKKVKALSKGMREKLNLALVIARRAHLYVLDEPISGVDPAARDYILGTILDNYTEEGAILISTHSISDVEQVLNDCIMLQQGSIVLSGDAEALRAEHGKTLDQLFREVFRC